jgi:hypothetical protein
MVRIGDARGRRLAGWTLAGIAILAWNAGRTEEGMPTTPTTEPGTLPPIDLEAPAAVGTATFALG